MPNETIADIVREMRDYNDTPPPRRAWFDLADRIEAAVKATIYTDNSETLHNALAENERLRAALDECVRCAERYEMDDDYQMSDICRDIRDCRRDAMGDEYLSRERENKESFEKVLELAGCLTNMSIVDYVHHKATHATMKFEDGHLMPIEDPVIHRYKLIEEQMIPVFLMLKDAVRDAKRIVKEGEANHA